MATLAQRREAEAKKKSAAKAERLKEVKETQKALQRDIVKAADRRQRQKLADKIAADRDAAATKAAKDKAAKDKAAKDKKKKDTKKKDTKKKDTKKKTTGGNIKDAASDTAARRSPTTYKPKVPIAKKGSKKVFHGTNIPTTGYTPTEIRDYNARLKADIDAGDSRGANDVIFSIAFQKGGGEGNPRVGAVQSGMYKLNKGNLWAEDNINSTNDRYVIRDASGKPTGDEVRFSDQHGVVKGKANEWKSTGSWGENARAGILEGRPTTTAPPSGILASIVDLDDPNKTILAGPGAGSPYTGDARTDTGRVDTGRADIVRTRPTGGRGEYLATKYDRPGLEDWSRLAPPEMPGTLGTAPAQAALLDRGLADYQTWRRPGVGEAFKYQPPAAPTYATRASLLGGASPLVTNNNTSILDNNDTTNNNQQLNNPFAVNPNQVDWGGVPVRNSLYTGYGVPDTTEGTLDAFTSVGGESLPLAYDPNEAPYKDFMDFTTRMNQVYYPGRQEAAQAAGAAGLGAFTPRGAAFREAVPNTALAWQNAFGGPTQQNARGSVLDQMIADPQYAGLLVKK